MEGYSKAQLQETMFVQDDAVECPMCSENMVPKPIAGISRVINRIKYGYFFVTCTHRDCKMPFLLQYDFEIGGKTENYHKSEIYYYEQTDETPAELEPYEHLVSKRSFYKNFVKIYCQAYAAEGSQLDHLYGMGYRKSLEFLLKDYAIHLYPDKKQSIEKQAVADIISNYYKDLPLLQKTAKAASWLGNDHVHYLRKWPAKDISDLKKVIIVTAHSIEQLELQKEYIRELGLE